MIIVFVVLGLCLLLVVGWWLTPKGNLLHEVLWLPDYHFKLQGARQRIGRRSRHFYGKHRAQHFDLFEPKNMGHVNTVVIWYHGGGWQFGNARMFRTYGDFFVARRCVAVLPTYRKLPFHNYYHLREDLDQLLCSVDALLNARGYGSVQYILGGMSAGANLATHLALDHLRLHRLGFDPRRIKGLLVCGGPLSLRQMPVSYPLLGFAGSKNSKRFRAADPIRLVKQADHVPHILIVHGHRDGMVPYASAVAFAERWCAIHGEDTLHFYTLPKGTHLDSVRWVYAAEDAQLVVLRWLDKIVRRTVVSTSGQL